MKPQKRQYIQIPVEWLDGLLEKVKIVEENESRFMELVGYASSADVLLEKKPKLSPVK